MDTDYLHLIPSEGERAGQYCTWAAAATEARRLSRTGVPHHVVKTVTWRNLNPRRCYTVVMG